MAPVPKEGEEASCVAVDDVLTSKQELFQLPPTITPPHRP
jgi:hypothetical protein